MKREHWCVSADVGIHGVAWAVWDTTPALVACGYTPNPLPEGRERRTPAAWAGLARAAVGAWGVPPGAHLVVETPQVYARAASAVDPADLLQLQSIAACLTMAHTGTSSTVLPAEWKGQVPKEIHLPRIRGRLEWRCWADFVRSKVPAEVPRNREHDLLDAIGIGLVFLGLWDLRARGGQVTLVEGEQDAQPHPEVGRQPAR